MPAQACLALANDTSCGSLVAAYRVGTAGDRPAGIDALAARDDLVLDNGLIRAVIDAADHNQHLSLSGGTLIDLAPANGPDGMNQVMQAVGILPRDQAQFTSVELAEVTPLSASVIARGSLYEDKSLQIITRYELRACETGIRMRTEVFNGSRIPQTFFLTDAYFWGDRGPTPFAATPNVGFTHPGVDLLTIGNSFREYPFTSAQTHIGVDDVSYATVPCDRKTLTGFNTTTLSASGRPRQVVMPGDGLSFERILYVAKGAGSSGAQAMAMQARAAMFHEASVTISGTARLNGDRRPRGAGRDLSLVFVSGETPWAEAVPDADGRFSVRVPTARAYSVQAYSFGRPVLAPKQITVADVDVTLDMSDIPAPGSLLVTVRDQGGNDLDAELVLRPTGSSNEASVAGDTYGSYKGCAPYLGPPHGSSPACNRVLVVRGRALFDVPPGEYWVYATNGPDSTLGRQKLVINAGDEKTLAFVLQKLPDIFPADSLQSDFHVHGGRSFDTQIPDFDRVASFLASGVQVIAASDHDVVGSYSAELMRAGIEERLFIMPATEMTHLVLFYKRDGSIVPRTLGHFNFWPMVYDPLMPRNGGAWDELKEPGALYDEMTPLIGPHGVKQLNHPYAYSKLGRDEGYARSIGYKVDDPIPAEADKTPAGQWLKKPGGGLRNIDHDTQEVMNGSETINFMQYRALWYTFLKQGYLRAGTANSDTHTLNIEQTGYPRNIVLTPHSFPNVDVPSFNAAVRDGRMVGTNGPYIDATIEGHGPSITAFHPSSDAEFRVIVRAAPWIPVDELRVLVNGKVAQTLPVSDLDKPKDPFGVAGVVRKDVRIPLSTLLTADGFVTFEAGLALLEVPLSADYNVPENLDENDEPLPLPAERASESDARYHIDSVSPGTWPTAFTNPFVIDRDGDGWKAPGL